MPSWVSKARTALSISFATLSYVRLGRLIVEDPNVKAPCWFSRRSTDVFHVPAQILRLLFQIILAPVYIWIPHNFYGQISNYSSASWAYELTSTPDAVLTTAPGGGAGAYAPTGSTPRWVLRVQIVNGAITVREQVPWSEDVRNRGYKALSYPMDSAYVLFQEAGLSVEAPPTEKRRFTLRDRKRIAERLLIEYCSATRDVGNRTEYIWLDEFCLSDDRQPDNSPERNRELGRLADIFRNASQVAVFCHEENCDHSSTTCIWGTRLFTIGKILHASEVIRLTRQQDPDGVLRTHAYQEAALSWQNAIHALVVEAITRDLAGTGFEEHKFLGKALNGLLPRRARLEDLRGEDGWTDLAWLLELNQVCSLGEGGWLGPPIRPVAGNERLEPIVHAFPVGMSDRMGIMTPLCVIGSKTVGLRKSLERDPFGLYNNKDMRGLKWLSLFFLVLFWVIAFALIATNWTTFVAIAWVSSSIFVMFEIAVGTIYLQRDGWIFLEDSTWGHDPQQRLRVQDPKLAELIEWGDRQLIPNWNPPGEKVKEWANGTLLDLNNGVMVKVFVSGQPNALIALAIHGSGVTSMLVDRREDLESITTRSGTLCIGIPSEDMERRVLASAISITDTHFAFVFWYLRDGSALFRWCTDVLATSIAQLPRIACHPISRVFILNMPGSRLTPGSRIFRRCFTSTPVPQRAFILPDFRNLDTQIPDHANAIRFRDTDKDTSQVFRYYKSIEHVQFMEKNMSTVFNDRPLLDTLSKMPLKSLHLSSAKFHNINHLCSFIRRFPSVKEVYCSRLRLLEERPLRNTLLEEGPALETLRMDSEDLWCPALDGSFGSIDQLRNVTIMDVKYKHLPDIALFLQRTAQQDRAKGNSSWKRNPPPLDISHLKSLGIDIHGRYKLIGIKQPVVILKWWIDMLKGLAEKGQASNLEDLLLVVGICRREPYILEDLEGTWQLLDSLLTQNFPAFKSLRVAIKVFRPTTMETGVVPQESDRTKLPSFTDKEDAQGHVWDCTDK
ncbi:hypothetical protein EDD18DRAFT_1106450 [Armillaria luteobubalina]|uniref:Heterokaryon incompatibility domain-containing protein n=1 Tax=Armillaria luteobubalina TaxID=153913 RepID=A0AA39TMU5_9AGAR|nr:hypothetical protein EDD18DRAFT_1106450 [Armillaria luteobubalina]